ncbi:OTU domain-containing protein 3 [Latimeria chalumnae]|uniref:OTU domain-containing protein 3 n=1 Tax=Latimeria chalumnae TaxID=7897 RepID=UPI00313F0FDF
MSRKQIIKGKPNKKAELERKRDEKAARRALAKERKNRAQEGGEDDEEFVSFANQLQVMGLKLREVPGDGNCLFRALGDQLEGHSLNHLKHRQETVDYMIQHREDFEPFVEDDVPFDKHVSNLAKPGTFAGNDAIVAFARINQVNVVIHQLNAPLWQIRGTDKLNARELHIAYRYGEHYDSVRRVSDNSESPAHLKMELLGKDNANKKDQYKVRNLDEEKLNESEAEVSDETEDAVQKVRNATGCCDTDIIIQNLEAENYNIESTIFAILQVNEIRNLSGDEEVRETQSSLWNEHGSGSRIFGNQSFNTENNRVQSSTSEENKGNRNKAAKLSNKQRKEQQRLEKKRRQEERHRQKVIEGKSNRADNNENKPGSDTKVTLVKTFATLNI